MAEPKIAQKSPYVIDVKPGKYAFCTCGESTKQPYCDGTHLNNDFDPVIVDVEEDKKIAWCGCKHSNNLPFCDGTHNKV